jgi:hypothetical protein
MKTLSKRFTDTSRLITGGLPYPPAINTHFATERHLMTGSSARQDSWTILRTSQINALLVGPRRLTEAAVATIERGGRQPMTWWAPDQGIDVPELHTGTLVIRDVDCLDVLQQERLTQWIGAHSPGVQVLALASTPLFAKVEGGQYSAALYYRVNTVVIEVRAWADLP